MCTRDWRSSPNKHGKKEKHYMAYKLKYKCKKRLNTLRHIRVTLGIYIKG